MIFLIDPGNLQFKKCPSKVCEVLCTAVCSLCKDLCLSVAEPLYGVPPREE